MDLSKRKQKDYSFAFKFFSLNSVTLCLSLLFILTGIFLFPDTAFFSDVTSENIIALTNQERLVSGLPALTANQLLTKAAYDKGQEILATKQFQHTIDGRKFSTWIREAGYLYSYVGENLAINFSNGEDIIVAWKNSPTHNRNLLNEYFKEIGVAVLEGKFQDRDTTLVVQIFGAPPKGVLETKILGTSASSKEGISSSDLSIPPFSMQSYPITFNDFNESLLTHVNIANTRSNNNTISQYHLSKSALPASNNLGFKKENQFASLAAYCKELNIVWPVADLMLFISILLSFFLLYLYIYLAQKTYHLAKSI
jgi:hypothetical protein